MRFRRVILALCCVLLLSVCANAAAARAETMKVAMTVDENGTAKAEVSLHVVCDSNVARLAIGLGPNVSGVRLDGHNSETVRSGGQTSVVLDYLEANPVPAAGADPESGKPEAPPAHPGR